jgi:hypothetical protein
MVVEGFSLSHVSILAFETEEWILYGARSAQIDAQLSSAAFVADDVTMWSWSDIEFSRLTVQNGFLSLPAIAGLHGLTVSELSGVYETAYTDIYPALPDEPAYGLPLWVLASFNSPQVPVFARMAAKDSAGSVRNLDFVLYLVQIGVLELSGTAYKNGMFGSYTGSVLWSEQDEAGRALSQMSQGRLISSPQDAPRVPAFGA